LIGNGNEPFGLGTGIAKTSGMNAIHSICCCGGGADSRRLCAASLHPGAGLAACALYLAPRILRDQPLP